MLFRFPPVATDNNDASYLYTDGKPFAKLKIESKAGRRTVLITEHTLIFVIRGVKLLHFQEETLSICQNSVFLLRTGIYVMAEYIEEGLDFEALMIFLPDPVLKSFLSRYPRFPSNKTTPPCVVFPVNTLIRQYKEQLRQYFNESLLNYKQLVPLKQLEILNLLCASGHEAALVSFIRAAVSTTVQDMDAVIQQYILQPITIAELAKLCNRSLASFKRDFKKQYGVSPRLYINQQRLQYARVLLQDTHQQVSDIAFECGFESPSYFIKRFKEAFGITPQAIRARTTIE